MQKCTILIFMKNVTIEEIRNKHFKKEDSARGCTNEAVNVNDFK